ncbi:MAG: ABC transporter permease [Rhodopirellula sp.]|nr:ABC transporter permease [Rhodopirellula sp.]
MGERIRQMLIKEFIQVLRDPRMRLVIFVIPVVQTVVIGFAVTTDVRNIRTAVVDRDHSPASRELLARFVGSGYFDATEYTGSDRRAAELIDRGEVSAVLRIHPGFEADLRSQRTARLQIIVDGTDSNTAGIVLGYVNKIASDFSDQVLAERLERSRGGVRRPGRVQLTTRAWFNENLESRNYFVPGVIVIVVSLITLLLTSMAVVREKEIGTMEQVMVSPIKPIEFILGKTVPFAIIGFADVILVTIVGTVGFQVPLRGSLPLLLLGTGLYLLTMLGIGLLISTISQTQQQAMMATFFFFFPAMLLSGFVFPIANMPAAVQWCTYLNPLRYFLVIVRSIFLKGVGLEVLWPPMVALAVMGIAVLWLVSQRFKKTLA